LQVPIQSAPSGASVMPVGKIRVAGIEFAEVLDAAFGMVGVEAVECASQAEPM